MKLLLALIVVFLLSFSVKAQTDQPPYRLSAELQRQIEQDTVPWKMQKAAWAYSFMGDYPKALEAWATQYGNMNRKVTAQDSATFAAYTPRNATEYILQQAPQEQILIINEAHHNPLHRTFTQSLLEDLHKQGYRYLGLEGLYQQDSLINQRKYPVQESGYYAKEPQFGNLIREAMRLGFTVFGYDAEGNGKVREIGQARNIQKVLQRDPKAKIILHCGFDHINEGPSQAWEKAMAGRLKEFTGIDPFTIDQEAYTETSDNRFDQPFFQLSRLDYPAVYVHKDTGKPFAGSGQYRTVDAVVVHPRTTYVSGRPNWLWFGGKRKSYQIPPAKIKLGFPCLVMAYKAGENELAVPMDVVEFNSAQDIKPLVLPKGSYRVKLKDSTGKEQELQVRVK
ncbi:hypothetical protein [Rufibacter roseus]|uniref:Uncharacterized protein n=1 Tax=Rufibacter roseus TaxID=1567108 RepID=A0ABW2DIB0_9BACT|nr:hypothetical protein [Rufibacter roseus]